MGTGNKFSAHFNSFNPGLKVSSEQLIASDLVCFEHAQKLDLLLHLLVNLRSTLVLRGVSGVGKTTLLKAVLSSQVDFGDIFLLSASETLSFELLQNKLRVFVNKSDIAEEATLDDILEYYEHQSRYLILMIDDAVQLVPGLIKLLLEFTERYQVLRLVFVFTPEEYLLANKTEKLVSSCYFIDLPELNLQQCQLFLQKIVASEKTIYKPSDINAAFVSDVYMETKGIPGTIVQRVVGARKKSFSHMAQLMALSVLIFIVSAFVNAYLWEFPKEEKARGVRLESSTESKFGLSLVANREVPAADVLVTLTSPPIQAEAVLPKSKVNYLEPHIARRPSNIKKLELVEDKVRSDIAQKVAVNSSVKEEKEKKDKTFLDNRERGAPNVDNDDMQWLLSQNERQYTLQLMALSNKQKLLAEQEKYLRLGYKTFLLARKSKNLNDYVLLYGHYPTVDAAKQAMHKLPKELRKSWPRRFGALQNSL